MKFSLCSENTKKNKQKRLSVKSSESPAESASSSFTDEEREGEKMVP